MPKVIIYTKSYCGFCHRAKNLLQTKSVPFDEIDVTSDSAKEQEMQKLSGQDTVPQIWIGEQHIGGCDDLHTLESRGELDALLQAGD